MLIQIFLNGKSDKSGYKTAMQYKVKQTIERTWETNKIAYTSTLATQMDAKAVSTCKIK